MATVRVRRGVRGVTYEVQVRAAGHKPVTRSFSSKTLARKWGVDTEARLERGESVTNEARRHTIEEVIDRFLKSRPELGRDTKAALNWWKSHHGERLLSAVTPVWLTELRDGWVGEAVKHPQDGREYRTGAAWANRRVTYLAATLGKRGAISWGWLRSNPAAEVSKLPEPPGRTRYLTDLERTALLTACSESSAKELLPFVLCALSSGARAGELLALRWQDVDTTTGTAVIHTSKTGKGRTLYFVGQALTALQAHSKVRGIDPTARVFASDPQGRFPFQYGAPFRAVVKPAELGDFHFHDLRHSCASYLAQSGASLLEIGEVLGHKSQHTTARYAHLAKGHGQELVARVLGAKLA